MSKEKLLAQGVLGSLIQDHIKKKGKSVVLYVEGKPYRIMRGDTGEIVIREVEDDIQALEK